jgi:hypothetical protein
MRIREIFHRTVWAVAWVAVSASAQDETELLVNPGFEQNSDPDKLPDGWGKSPDWKGVFTVVADAATAHRGSYYLKIEYSKDMGPGEGGRLGAACRPAAGKNGRVKVGKDDELLLSFYAMGKGAVHVGFFEYDESRWLAPTVAAEPKEIEIDSGEWRKHEFVHKPSPAGRFPGRGDAGVSYVSFGFWAEGTVFVDDFSFKKLKRKESGK